LVHHETAYAKINLALHVRRRREDGYHEIETLFAFVDDGDRLTFEDSAWDQVNLGGEFASGIDYPLGNLVVKALNAIPHEDGVLIDLEKRLPVSAGLGGGSADAGAVFRAMAQRVSLPEDWRERAALLGADVPACVASRACIGTGTGTDLREVDNDLAGMACLLVNPRVPLATGAVFKGWDGLDRGAMPGGSVREIALAGGNDLEVSAAALCPAIAEVLRALRQTDPWLARMSGSGATCFALYASSAARDAAAARLRENHPGWWQMAGRLR
jgi:4-diphosphocytidyl-2-C-methyl-D-erythritol kinase